MTGGDIVSAFQQMSTKPVRPIRSDQRNVRTTNSATRRNDHGRLAAGGAERRSAPAS